MDRSVLNMRLGVLGAAFALVLIVFTVRLWSLQLAQWGQYMQKAAQNKTTVVYEAAPRGLILDRNGDILGDNRYTWNLHIIPKELPSSRAELEAEVAVLAGILGASAGGILNRVETIKEQSSLQSVPLDGSGDDLTLAEVAQIEGRASELPGTRVVEKAQRIYPRGSLAAHLLGYARPITEKQYERYGKLIYPDEVFNGETEGMIPAELEPLRIYSRDSIFGQSGVERLCEIDLDTAPPIPILQGRRGRTVYEVDVTNRPVRVLHREEPSPGATVYLALDRKIQRLAEKALASAIENSTGKTGGVVLMDLKTGGIIAMASFPTFDPNKWIQGWESQEEFNRLNKDPRKLFLNKVIGGRYPPASTFKIISATAALTETDAEIGDTYVCKGEIHAGADHQPFGCWDVHGRLDFLNAIAYSCDVYFYELVRKRGLSSRILAEYAHRFGLGELTGTGLPGEIPGLVPNPDFKKEEMGEDWRTGDTLNMVIGQGFLTATVMQVAVYTGVVATDGDVIEPNVVRKIAWPEHMHREPTLMDRKVRRHLDLSTALTQVRRGMRLAVTTKNGTAAILRELPTSAAGKTGSAEHLRGHPTHAWFTAFAPYENPRFVCTALVTEGGWGSRTAGPICVKVLKAALDSDI